MAINMKDSVQSGIEQGIDWAVRNAPFYGRHNGYVRIPDDHPWALHAGDYHKIQELAGGFDDLPDGLVGGSVELTYAAGGWIGFDTLHAWDDEVGWTADLTAEMAKIWARIVAKAESEAV